MTKTKELTPAEKLEKLKALEDKVIAEKAEALKEFEMEQLKAQMAQQPLPPPFQNAPNPSTNDFLAQQMNNPAMMKMLAQLTGQSMPMPQQPYPQQAHQQSKASPHPNYVSKREAALDIKKHLARNNTLFFLGLGVGFGGVAGSYFSSIAGASILIVGLIPMAWMYRINVMEIKRLEMNYGV